MSAIFWVATIVMAVLAFSFVASPLIANRRRTGLVGIAVVLPLFAAGLYWYVGSPQAASAAGPKPAPVRSERRAAAATNESIGSVASMVDGLANRLKDDSDDGKSWLLLARSYEHLKRYPEARDAYAKAVALGEYDEALARLSESPAAVESVPAQVFGNLQISEESKALVLPTDTVFIFARAVGGPPMPVAVLQRPASELPLDFLLNDAQAMSAEVKLSNFEQVIVTARISRSGIATDALRDLEAVSDPIVVAENPHLNLTIE